MQSRRALFSIGWQRHKASAALYNAHNCDLMPSQSASCVSYQQDGGKASLPPLACTPSIYQQLGTAGKSVAPCVMHNIKACCTACSTQSVHACTTSNRILIALYIVFLVSFAQPIGVDNVFDFFGTAGSASSTTQLEPEAEADALSETVVPLSADCKAAADAGDDEDWTCFSCMVSGHMVQDCVVDSIFSVKLLNIIAQVQPFVLEQ